MERQVEGHLREWTPGDAPALVPLRYFYRTFAYIATAAGAATALASLLPLAWQLDTELAQLAACGALRVRGLVPFLALHPGRDGADPWGYEAFCRTPTGEAYASTAQAAAGGGGGEALAAEVLAWLAGGPGPPASLAPREVDLARVSGAGDAMREEEKAATAGGCCAHVRGLRRPMGGAPPTTDGTSGDDMGWPGCGRQSCGEASDSPMRKRECLIETMRPGRAELQKVGRFDGGCFCLDHVCGLGCGHGPHRAGPALHSIPRVGKDGFRPCTRAQS